MRAIEFSGAGGEEVMRLARRPDPSPGVGEVLVAVQFAGINRADLAQRAGRYPAPAGVVQDIPGIEVAGRVLDVGDRSSSWAPGDRVFGLVGGGGLADRVVVPTSTLSAVPAALDERAAAAVPEAFITAHDAILTQGGLARGEMLMVRGANGAVGTAAVQLAIANGATAIGVSRSSAGRELVRSLGARAEADSAAVEDSTVDVVLELVGGDVLLENLRVIRTMGRVLLIGIPAGLHSSLDFRTMLFKRAVVRGSTLRARTPEEKTAVVERFRREVVPLLAARCVTPVIDSVFPADAAVEAFRRLELGGVSGKILLEFEPRVSA